MTSKSPNKKIYIGLMSGTSADGIDAAAIRINVVDGKPNCKLLAFESFPYSKVVKGQIFELFDTRKATADKVSQMNFLLGRLFGEAAEKLIHLHNIDKTQIAAIGSHGQTIYHEPNGHIPNTLQIGEGSLISRITGIPCVSDFRTADISAGGNGAPLVPFTEYVLFSNDEKNIILQNIGGIANSTVLKARCDINEVFAFDNGPGNMLIDGLMSICYGKDMDSCGKIAAFGNVNGELLNKLLDEPYYSMQPPKTTGRELFGKQYCLYIKEIAEGIANEDIISTVTALTARVIANSYKDFILPHCKVDEMIVGGGGSYNTTMMNFLNREMSKHFVKVCTQEEKGESSDAKEAVAFALLAYYTMAGLPNNLPSATGAKYPAVLGKISF